MPSGTALLIQNNSTSVSPGTGDIILGWGHNRLRAFRVDTIGSVFANNGYFAGGVDFAESVRVVGDRKQYEPGDVMVISTAGDEKFALSSEPYSTLVAGIHSTKPGVTASSHPMDPDVLAREVPLALVGIVPCKVTTQNGSIAIGDLLVTSWIPGYAMKGTDPTRMMGAVVGKALAPLEANTGKIPVLVSLQ